MPQMNDPGREGDSTTSLRNEQPPVILVSSDEEEDDSDVDVDDDPSVRHPEGYEPLPQDIPILDQSEEEEENESVEEEEEKEEEREAEEVNRIRGRLPDDPNLHGMVEESRRSQLQEELNERATIWKGQTGNDTIALDSEKVASIRTAMAKFSMPPSAIPVWAKDLSEEEWKGIVRMKLNESKPA